MTSFSTGLPGLDRMLQGLAAGDNVVWQVDTVEDYVPFLTPFSEEARRRNRKLVYFRYARHRELIQETPGGLVCRLRPEDGFESFLEQILDVIEKQGVGACYVFDWLSDLAADWYSDHMLGNFFRITCPYLYDLKTIAYFGLRRNHHSREATEAIGQTAQVILEVYRKQDRFFVHPVKVFERHSPTLYLLHSWEGDQFRPVTNSALISEILATVPQPWIDFSVHRPGVWLRTLHQAQATLKAARTGQISSAEAEAFFERILKMVVTRDERFVALARQYFDLADLFEIMKRMIGTGLIGGKSLGMLLARAILRRANPDWADRLERHDSFFIGSDVFYTYLVENGCWWLRRRQGDFQTCLEKAEQARQRILRGAFPESVRDQFREMLEYFGQSPIIVRSSSLLEDNYGNAFSGKYESVFCANQGSPAERLEACMAAVRTVYASTMAPESLVYRQHRGLLDRDEQMALLIQRVSGEMHGEFFLPQVAGVGFSFNPYVWHERIDPRAGVLRLVFGLGTRAVDRTGDDYTRLVAVNEPMKRPESPDAPPHQFRQRRVDLIDLHARQLVSKEFDLVVPNLPPYLRELFADWDEPRPLQPPSPEHPQPWILNFDRLLSQTSFAADLGELLSSLQTAYHCPVDIEFTANCLPAGHYRINVLQCRPFQVKVRKGGDRVRLPAALRREDTLLESRGPIVGHSLDTAVDQLIYVVPEAYSSLAARQRYALARTIGRLTHLPGPGKTPTIVLVGPGRWGTTVPALGVPVSFAEINTVSAICEVAVMQEGLVPDISLGTHFFNDLVETDMLYLAVAPGQKGDWLNEALIRQLPNRLPDLLPGAAALADALWVVEPTSQTEPGTLLLHVDSMKQHALCYFDRSRWSLPARAAQALPAGPEQP